MWWSEGLSETDFERPFWDFPGSPVVKNPSANAEDTNSFPGPGRYHALQSN